MNKKSQQIAAFVFGVTFVLALLALAILFPRPTPFQYIVFRVVLALAAAGVAAMIPGFLTVAVSGVVQAGGALAVFAIVFFYNPATLVVPEPERKPFAVSLHDRTIDMANWTYIPDSEIREKKSGVVFLDRIKARRNSRDGRQFLVRHATTSPIDPEFSSETHRIEVRPTLEQPEGGLRAGIRIFDVFADTSGEPVDQWFEFRLKSLYWNAINNPERGWAALPLVYETDKAFFELIFPPSKPVKYWERREGSRDTHNSDLVSDGAIQTTPNNKSIKWSIEAPRQDWVYTFRWDW